MAVAKQPLPQGALSSMPEYNRGVLNQIANNELATELAPFIENRPVAQIGFDPNRTSMLPTYLPKDKEKYAKLPDAAWSWHPLERLGLRGNYFKPGERSYPFHEDVWEAYGLDPAEGDRIAIYQNPSLNSNINRVKPRTRNQLLETLAHESEHRGRRILRQSHLDRNKAAKSAMLMMEMDNPDHYATDPEYEKMGDIRWSFSDDPTRGTLRSLRSDELATRIGDIESSIDPEEKDKDIRYLRKFFINPELSRGIDRETFQRSPKNIPDYKIKTFFDKRLKVKDPKTGRWDWDTRAPFGRQIPIDVYKQLLQYGHEKRGAEKWLKARRGYPKDQLISNLLDD